MFCTNCGARLTGDEFFCAHCGTPVQESPQSQRPVSDSPYLADAFKETIDHVQEDVFNPKVVYLKSPRGVVKECKLGFSWTQFFFGFFVPFFRGDVKYGLIQLGLTFFIGMATGPVAGLLVLGVNLFFMLQYNRLYISGLLENKGYIPSDERSAKILIQEGF